MGWLGRLFGQGETTNVGGAAQTPAEPPDPFDRFSDLTTPEHRPLLEAFLGDLARHLDGGTMVARPNDTTIEAHGRLGGFPVRALAEESNGLPELKLTLRLPREYGNVVLQCDPSIDQTKERPDEWSETMRIFFAKSIFVAGSVGHDPASNRYVVDLIREQAQRFAVLPEATREHVMAVLSMETTFEIRKDEIRVWLRRKATSTEVKQTALALLGLMVEVANAIPAVAGGGPAGVSPAAMGAAPGVVGRLVKCGYCSANFFLDRRAACCHCGAPFTEV